MKKDATRNYTLNLLEKCSKSIFSKLDINEVYKATLNCFYDVTGVEIALLLIMDSENRELKLVWQKGVDSKDIKNSTITLNKSFSGKATQQGEKKISHDIDKFSEFICKQKIYEKKIVALISLPIKIADKVIGIVNLYLTKSDHFLPVEESMLDILADQAATAIRNANLYQHMKHTLEDMDLMIKIARTIGSTLELDRVLNSILAVTQQIANTDITFFWYKDLVTAEWKRVFPANLNVAHLKLPRIEQGEGIIGHVLKTGKPYLCQNTTKDEHYYPTWKETGSELAIPLIIDDEVRGILDVECTNYDAFSKRQIQLLKMLTEEAAITLRNAQLYEIADKKTRQFNTLREIGEALSQRKSLPMILNIIADESLNIVGYGKKVAAVMLIDKEKKMLEAKAVAGELVKKDYLDLHVPLSQPSIVTWVVRNGKFKLAQDVKNEPEYLEINRLVKSEICIPLCFRDEVIGVIDIESSELNAFDEQDVALLQTLADNTAIAVKIAELYDIRFKQLEALYNTSIKISSSLNLREVLNTIATEALMAIGSRKRILSVQLLDEGNDSLEIKVATGYNSGHNYVGTKIKKDEGISGWVVRNRKPYLCPHVKQDSYYMEINPSVKSELCVPIIFSDEVIGVINVESMKESDFGEHELQLLKGLANQASIAIKNARLNEELANTQYQLTEALGVTVIGETLAGLTHDIRTSSSLISGEAQWIEFQYENNHLQPQEVIEAMKKIQSHVERIETMTNDLMERSQQLPAEFFTVNLSDIIRSSVYLISGYALRQQVVISVDYQSLQFSAQVDISRLKRVFINLIKNAIEAMPHGGTLKIRAKEFEKYFEIFFKDTGEGIARENLKKIWNPFFTLKKGGSGLGLPNCRRIIEVDHNGKIRVKSIKGKGTTVSIRLPYYQQT